MAFSVSASDRAFEGDVIIKRAVRSKAELTSFFLSYADGFGLKILFDVI